MIIDHLLRADEIQDGYFYTAGYDSPMKFWNRRNEVMFLVPGTSR